MVDENENENEQTVHEVMQVRAPAREPNSQAHIAHWEGDDGGMELVVESKVAQAHVFLHNEVFSDGGLVEALTSMFGAFSGVLSVPTPTPVDHGSAIWPPEPVPRSPEEEEEIEAIAQQNTFTVDWACEHLQPFRLLRLAARTPTHARYAVLIEHEDGKMPERHHVETVARVAASRLYPGGDPDQGPPATDVPEETLRGIATDAMLALGSGWLVTFVSPQRVLTFA